MTKKERIFKNIANSKELQKEHEAEFKRQSKLKSYIRNHVALQYRTY